MIHSSQNVALEMSTVLMRTFLVCILVSIALTMDCLKSIVLASPLDPLLPQNPAASIETGTVSHEPAIQSENEESEENETKLVLRSFLYKEFVLSGFFAVLGVKGIPPGDTDLDYFEITHRPPGNYVGVDYVGIITPAPSARFPLTGINLHPRLVLDRMETDSSLGRIKFAPQDFWLRFSPGQVDRLTLRLGQFAIPYGVNPILAPRQRFILPLEATDLGLKWDWGLGVKGPLGEFDWEAAATIGSGETLHSPRLFQNSDRESYLFTGRLGAPTYWDSQFGVSLLYGELPFIRGAHVFDQNAVSRWRIGFDGFRKAGTYLMFGAQAIFGQDGFKGDEEFVGITMGRTATVRGYRGMVDWVFPENEDLRFVAQIESVIRDVSTSGSDDTALILEFNYSLTTSLSMMIDHRWEINRSMGEENSATYLTFVSYSR